MGHSLGQLRHWCVDPWKDVYSMAVYYYYPKVKLAHELSKHGISIGINDEVIFV